MPVGRTSSPPPWASPSSLPAPLPPTAPRPTRICGTISRSQRLSQAVLDKEPRGMPPTNSQSNRKRLLITGAAGKVGHALRTHLRDRYDFRLLDLRRVDDAQSGDEVVV